MLPPDYLISRIEPITLMYSDLHTAILTDIARHIRDTLAATGKTEIIPSAAYQVERLMQTGMLRDEIITRVADINRMGRAEVRRMFEDVAIKSWEYDARVYRAAGLEPVPIMQSPAMLRILDAGITKSLGGLDRLTSTAATNAESRFNELLNLGYKKVASGAYSYRQAIENTVDELAREGVKSFDYASGRSISLEAGVRRAILTGANQTAGHITQQSMIDMGVDLCRTSAHIGARNAGEGFKNHESWQGRVFSIKGKTDEYEDFSAACGYGDVQGIYGANCKHSHGPYFKGLSPEAYRDTDLDEMSGKVVTYTDWKTDEEKTVSYYDAQQTLRGLERKIKLWKRRQTVKEAAGVDSDVEKVKIRQWQKRVKAFTEQTGIKRDYSRERIKES